MTPQGIPPEVVEKARQLRAAGVPLAEIERYIQSKVQSSGPSPTQQMVRQAIKTPEGKARLEQSNAELKAADEPSAKDYLRDVGETAETVAEGFPGGGLAMTGMRMLGGGQSYEDARNDINAETSDAGWASVAGQALGAAPAFAIPGMSALSPAQAGGAVGAASGLLSNEAEGLSPKERAIRAVVGGVGGAVAGKSAEMLGQQIAAIRADRATNTNRLMGQIRRMKVLPTEATGVAGDAPRTVEVPVVRGSDRVSAVDPTAGRIGGFRGNAPPPAPGPKPEINLRKLTAPSLDAFDIVPEAPPTAGIRTAAESFVPEGGIEGTPLPNQRLTQALADLSAQARSRLPLAERAGNQWGDAEIAMGLDQPPPDLGDLLKRSLDIVQKTGKLPKGPR